jgi:hypothetical protein
MANICREVKLLHQLICSSVEAVVAEAERIYVNPVIYSLFGFSLLLNLYTMDYQHNS